MARPGLVDSNTEMGSEAMGPFVKCRAVGPIHMPKVFKLCAWAPGEVRAWVWARAGTS